MLRSSLLALVFTTGALLLPAPADACSLDDPTPVEGPLGITFDEHPTAPANAAFFVRPAGTFPEERAELARDLEDDTIVSGTRSFYSERAGAALYRPDEPLVVGHTYEALGSSGREFTVVAAAEGGAAAPAVSALRVKVSGDSGCTAFGCGEVTTFTLEGVDALPDNGAFYTIRYAATEAEAAAAERIDAVTDDTFTFTGPVSGSAEAEGYAGIGTFDVTGRESARVVVPLVSEEDGGCRTMPRSSGAQLFAWLALAGVAFRRRVIRSGYRAAARP